MDGSHQTGRDPPRARAKQTPAGRCSPMCRGPWSISVHITLMEHEENRKCPAIQCNTHERNRIWSPGPERGPTQLHPIA